MKIALIGLGSVGQGLLHILKDKAAYLEETYNFKPEIVAVGTASKGTLYHPARAPSIIPMASILTIC